MGIRRRADGDNPAGCSVAGPHPVNTAPGLGKTWGSARTEGCVVDIGNARMGERRRMRWSPKVAHNVAVTGAAVLDGR